MGLLAEDGHVVEVAPRGQPPRLSLNRVGRHRATTFTGLCAQHDAEMFRALDSEQLDPENPEHLFLLAYRAVMREHHVLRRGEEMMRRAAALPQLSGRTSHDYFGDVARSFSRYRSRYFEPAFRDSDFDSLESRVVEIETSSATVAVSSLYSLDLLTRPDGDIARAALSVVPLSQHRSIAVISCVTDDLHLLEPELARVLDDDAHGLPLRLSHLILETSENFVLRPGFTEQWSSRKKRKIVKAAGLLSALHSVPDDDELMLFDL